MTSAINISKARGIELKLSKCQDFTGGVPNSASFTVLLLALDTSDVEVLQSAEIIYRDLKMHGLNVVFDDRNESAVVKLKDAELLGLPIRVTIGACGLQRGEVEVTFEPHSLEHRTNQRTNQQLKQMIRIDECVERVGEITNELLETSKSSPRL